MRNASVRVATIVGERPCFRSGADPTLSHRSGGGRQGLRQIAKGEEILWTIDTTTGRITVSKAPKDGKVRRG